MVNLRMQRPRLQPRTSQVCRAGEKSFSTSRHTKDNLSRSSPPSNAQQIGRPLQDRQYLYRDSITRQPIYLLKTALKTHLPPSTEHDTDRFGSNWLHLGFQHVYFRPGLTASMLCSDGTDVKFLPGPESVWKYRLWAGGSVRYNTKWPFSAGNSKIAFLAESVKSVKPYMNGEHVDKFMVTIQRQFYQPQQRVSENSAFRNFATALGEQDLSKAGLVETEKIIFFRDPPRTFQDSRTIRPPTGALHTHTTTLTRALLFQFSALTYNAHSIHLDRELARTHYGAQDLVVHGPLTMIMMLEFLRRSIQRTQKDIEGSAAYIVPKSIEYSNIQPLYVDRPLTLCCKPLPSDSKLDKSTPQSWQVWIQTGEGASVSCAAKSTIVVDLFTNSGKTYQPDQSTAGLTVQD